jgi:MYXO-CTERM domain-containing protein
VPRVARRTGLLAGLLGLTLAAAPGSLAHAGPPAQAETLTSEPAAIVGGTVSDTCAWPSVVALQTGGLCTGTLVHPRIVAYAAHCGTFHSKVLFGERVDMPAREVATVLCERNSDLFAVHSMDYAYCLLAEPVDDIAITPPLFGCDEELIAIGTPVTIVGFGDTSSEGPASIGIKHEAQTQVVGYLSTVGIGGMGVGADSGDSGGPAFVELDEGSWWWLGIVTGGGGNGATVQYVPAPKIVAWIEDRSGIDITPCHASDGSWAPTPACEGFYVQTEDDATWASACPSVRSGASDRCGPPHTELVDDDPPSVTFLDPLDGEVFPGAPVEFEVLAEADDGSGVGVAEVRLRIDGTAWIDALGHTGDEVPPYRFADLSFASDGIHVLELEAIDHFGNVALANATIVVGEISDSETDSGVSESDGESDTTGSMNVPADGCSCTTGSEGGPLAGLLLLALCGRLRMPTSPRSRH